MLLMCPVRADLANSLMLSVCAGHGQRHSRHVRAAACCARLVRGRVLRMAVQAERLWQASLHFERALMFVLASVLEAARPWPTSVLLTGAIAAVEWHLLAVRPQQTHALVVIVHDSVPHAGCLPCIR